VVYHGVEGPQRSSEGYRLLWYRSSQKEEQDRQARAERLRRARERVEQLRPPGRRGTFGSAAEAQAAGQRVLEQEQVERWLRLHIDEEVEAEYRPARAGRPGPNTAYRRVEKRSYRPRVEEDGEALARAGRCDGLFPLLTNDAGLSLEEALGKYKYQPFVEKRHEQLKAVFGVAPMWLKSVARVESLLWLYWVVELVQALLEREVRRRMGQAGASSLALYPEGRASAAPTAVLVLGVLEGHRRHRLLDEQGQELRRFHDEVPQAAQEVLALLGVSLSAYGID
jgi:transposase